MAAAASNHRSMEPLVLGRVIGDVIDMFVPCAEMSVTYTSRHVSNGCEIATASLLDPPIVHIHTTTPAAALYTLIMVDPDAPSPSEPSSREWIHWIVTDIPAGGDADQGCEIVEYEAPTPVLGIHRYVFTLWRQERAGLMVRPPARRNNFSTRAFASNNNLSLHPVAAVYFHARKQQGGGRRR